MKKLLLSFLLLCSFIPFAEAQLRLGAPFSDHMVLQRNSMVPIWGWSNGGNSIIEIKVSWSDEVYTTRSNAMSMWKIKVPTPEAGGPHEIIINNTLTIKDILIGEVWLCSGQSNMQWSALSGIDNAGQAIKNATNDQIRFLSIPRVGAATPQIDIKSNWQVCSPETMKSFSAVAYFFGKELQEQTNVPIGLINSSWGGTAAEVWTPKENINSDPEFSKWENTFPQNGYQPRAPGVLFNAMINPVIPFRIAGTIWYQGEANTANPYIYKRLFPEMIRSWRTAWGMDFPFYYVQLAPFKYAQPMIGALVQEAQLKTLSALENVGMAVINDIGNVNDIHPQNKLDVGKRLAYWALKKNYNKDIVCSGPIYQSAEKTGNSIVINFQYADGLYFEGDNPKALYISGADGLFRPAKAKIEGKQLIVSHPEIEQPEAVRYAFSNTGEGNLFNNAKLPASPFRTDDKPFVLTPVLIEIDQVGKHAEVQLSTLENVDEILYTLDGSTPGREAKKYNAPFSIDRSFQLKARAKINGRYSEIINEKSFAFSKATFCEVASGSAYNEHYKSSGKNALTDGLLGSKAYNDKNWQGYIGTDISATIDLGEVKKLNSIKTHFLQHQAVWIFLPQQVEIAISKDGEKFTTIHSQSNQLLQENDINIQTIKKSAIKKKARYIRITAKNAGPCPEWHPGAGEKSWLFIDEVIVD